MIVVAAPLAAVACGALTSTGVDGMAGVRGNTLPRMSGSAYAARLERRGYDVIAHGGSDDRWRAATLILAKPEAAHVIKVGLDPYGDPWPHYAAWCLHHPGPFRPTVRALRWHGNADNLSRFFVATMDRLNTPLSVFKKDDVPDVSPEGMRRLKQYEPTAVAIINALAGWYRMLQDEGIDYRRFGVPPSVYPRLCRRLAKRFRKAGMGDLGSFIEALSKAFPAWMPDPQPHNWMFTEEGRIVLIDPFSRSRASLPETEPRLTRPLTTVSSRVGSDVYQGQEQAA